MNVMIKEARNSSKRISILGFIDRLDGIYKATIKISQNEEYSDLLDLFLDYTLGNKVQMESVGHYSPLGFTSL